MSPDIKPGTFWDGNDLPDQFPVLSPITPEELRVEPRPDLVAKYRLFKKTVNPSCDVVYHPCGANDVSPSEAFPNSRVIYIELDETSVNALKESGFEAHNASVLEYDPGDVDILIMLNPVISPEIPARHVKDGGFALCNDYHGTATLLRNNPDFQIVGLIRVGKDRSLIYDSDALEDYWKDVETDEEFRNALFDWGAVSYESARKDVEALTGKTANILAEYKKIIADLIRKNKEEWERKSADSSAIVDSVSEPEQELFVIKHEGKEFIISTHLPRKKGTVDDLFVFQRVSKAK